MLEGTLQLRTGDVIVSAKGTVGLVAVLPEGFPRAGLGRSLALLRPLDAALSPAWLEVALRSRVAQDQFHLALAFAAQVSLPLRALATIVIPIPPRSSRDHLAQQVRERGATRPPPPLSPTRSAR